MLWGCLLIRVLAEIAHHAFEFQERERCHHCDRRKTALRSYVVYGTGFGKQSEHRRFVAPERLRRMMPHCGGAVNTKLLQNVCGTPHCLGSLLDQHIGSVRGGRKDGPGYCEDIAVLLKRHPRGDQSS